MLLPSGYREQAALNQIACVAGNPKACAVAAGVYFSDNDLGRTIANYQLAKDLCGGQDLVGCIGMDAETRARVEDPGLVQKRQAAIQDEKLKQCFRGAETSSLPFREFNCHKVEYIGADCSQYHLNGQCGGGHTEVVCDNNAAKIEKKKFNKAFSCPARFAFQPFEIHF